MKIFFQLEVSFEPLRCVSYFELHHSMKGYIVYIGLALVIHLEIYLSIIALAKLYDLLKMIEFHHFPILPR